ncbi:MAG: hypothetical protein AAF226_00800 [Verrucomicrobiota bacterium]
MRIFALLLTLLMIGCEKPQNNEKNGLRTEWDENADGTRSALLVKRNGMVIAEIAAVSNAFFIDTKGADEFTDIHISYYEMPNADTNIPEGAVRVLYDSHFNPTKIIDYDLDGSIQEILHDELGDGRAK